MDKQTPAEALQSVMERHAQSSGDVLYPSEHHLPRSPFSVVSASPAIPDVGSPQAAALQPETSESEQRSRMSSCASAEIAWEAEDTERMDEVSPIAAPTDATHTLSNVSVFHWQSTLGHWRSPEITTAACAGSLHAVKSVRA